MRFTQRRESVELIFNMASDEQDKAEKRRQEILKQMGLDDESVRESVESMKRLEERAVKVRWFGLLLAITTAITAFYFTLSSDVFRFHTSKNDDLMLLVHKQQEQITTLEAVVNRMQTNSFAVTNAISNQATQSVADHEKRIKTIEDVIMENPEKAMALPLIRQEQKALEESLVSIKHEVEQSSETLRWAFGLILTSALTIAGIFAGIIFKNKKEETDLRLKILAKKND